MNSKKTKLESVVKVSSKGQIVIPKKWRNAVNICEGEKLIIKVREDHVIELIPLKKSIGYFERINLILFFCQSGW
jgi:AbrB family looped-hinge helix DNA binding protein